MLDLARGMRRGTVAAAAILAFGTMTAGQYTRKVNVAHRGASAYAPEHTLAAYRLAIEQGADYVEQDLQITSDGVLVCLHDMTLERTTNVEEIFPDRARLFDGGKQWPVVDFTLEEIKRLDAGSWFGPAFAGERIPTWQEAIDLIRGKAGLFPEIKEPEQYAQRGFDMAAMTISALRKNGLERRGAEPRTPVIIQSSSAASLQRIRTLGSLLPLVLLIADDDPGRGVWLSDEGLRRARAFADGIGPAKSLLLHDRTLVDRARRAGLSVTPYTFRSGGLPAGRNVKDEMAMFLYELGVDAVFTANPDQFPKR
jgi:glycerophosphoryl diester phosphodiesterase